MWYKKLVPFAWVLKSLFKLITFHLIISKIIETRYLMYSFSLSLFLATCCATRGSRLSCQEDNKLCIRYEHPETYKWLDTDKNTWLLHLSFLSFFFSIVSSRFPSWQLSAKSVMIKSHFKLIDSSSRNNDR